MNPPAARIMGRCHCGNIELTFTTALRPEALPLRSDTCSFCAKHGARTTSDPRGAVRFVVRDHDRLLRYRFALETADFLVCRGCGVYVAALLSTPSGSYATLNANTFDCAPLLTQTVVPVSYDGETADQRIARRRERWTPVLQSTGGVS